jgi:hypothetical protein
MINSLQKAYIRAAISQESLGHPSLSTLVHVLDSEPEKVCQSARAEGWHGDLPEVGLVARLGEHAVIQLS